MTINNEQRDHCVDTIIDFKQTLEEQGHEASDIRTFNCLNVAAAVKAKLQGVDPALVDEVMLYTALTSGSLIAKVNFNSELEPYDRARYVNPFCLIDNPEAQKQAKIIQEAFNRAAINVLEGPEFDRYIWDAYRKARLCLSEELCPNEDQFIYGVEAEREENKWWATNPRAQMLTRVRPFQVKPFPAHWPKPPQPTT
ncbi:hypothetical protein ACFL3T_00055 [Patescibacteria group bacterium]